MELGPARRGARQSTGSPTSGHLTRRRLPLLLAGWASTRTGLEFQATITIWLFVSKSDLRHLFGARSELEQYALRGGRAQRIPAEPRVICELCNDTLAASSNLPLATVTSGGSSLRLALTCSAQQAGRMAALSSDASKGYFGYRNNIMF